MHCKMNRLKFDNPIDCTGCGACAAICPHDCIEIVKDSLGFNISKLVHPDKCIDCGLCSKTCPQTKKSNNQCQKSFCVYGQNLDREQLLESSSGGFFSLIAESVIDNNGYVWGVELNPDGIPRFICIDKKGDLIKLRGSKYSEVYEPLNFNEIRKQLNKGVQVLVSGTPCQILALRKFLGNKEYNNLILVDLLCYGIQSPLMWNLYLQDINPQGRKISNVSMRNKHYSWFNYSMKITFEDGSQYRKIRYKDPWLLTYSTSMFNRLSCSECQAKKFPRVSDFTIGDFWDIDYYKNPIKLDKKRGVSLVMMHTQKAQNMFDNIKSNFVFDVIPEAYMTKRIITLAKSAQLNTHRELFIADAYRLGFSNSVAKHMESGFSLWYKKRKNYLKYHIIVKFKNLIKKIICYRKHEN